MRTPILKPSAPGCAAVKVLILVEGREKSKEASKCVLPQKSQSIYLCTAGWVRVSAALAGMSLLFTALTVAVPTLPAILPPYVWLSQAGMMKSVTDYQC